MKITLLDNSVIETDDIVRISSIHDDGLDQYSIDQSNLSFTIKVVGGDYIPVSIMYHYADWAQKKLQITKLRKQLLGCIADDGE